MSCYTHKMANVSWPQIMWRQFILCTRSLKRPHCRLRVSGYYTGVCRSQSRVKVSYRLLRQECMKVPVTVRLEAAICILCKCNPLPFSRVDGDGRGHYQAIKSAGSLGTLMPHMEGHYGKWKWGRYTGQKKMSALPVMLFSFAVLPVLPQFSENLQISTFSSIYVGDEGSPKIIIIF